MELGVSHVLNLSSLTPIVDNIFDKYNKKFGTIRSFPDHDIRLFSIRNFIIFTKCKFYGICNTDSKDKGF